eukprot:scaffold582_cov385-Prasinococcus_capsulatus_cf.AAC.32
MLALQLSALQLSTGAAGRVLIVLFQSGLGIAYAATAGIPYQQTTMSSSIENRGIRMAIMEQGATIAGLLNNIYPELVLEDVGYSGLFWIGTAYSVAAIGWSRCVDWFSWESPNLKRAQCSLDVDQGTALTLGKLCPRTMRMH